MFKKAAISTEGIAFYPYDLVLPKEDMRAFWVAEAPSGEKLFVIELKSLTFVPYFGTAWCFFRAFVINTE